MLDPFTRENIAQGLLAAADEMFYTWGRTSQSTIIYEVLDYACGLTDAEGNLIGQANGATMFLGAITFSAKAALRKFGKENIKPGDMFLTNDPFTGSGTHLCDVAAVLPIFHENELVAFAVNKGHWNEIGGKNLGSWSTDATEIFQEGLQLPDVRIYDCGVFNESVRDIIAANSRTPEMTLGDLYAQTAALRIAESRVIELLGKYGRDQVVESIEHILESGRKLALIELSRMPKGEFFAEDVLDTNANGVADIPIKVKVTITDDSMEFDFTGTGDAVFAPINCSIYGTYSGARIIYHALVSPHTPANDGFYSPLKVIAPEGCLFNASSPYPVSCDWEPIQILTDVVKKALASAMPDRVPAGHFLSIIGTIIGGIDDKSKNPFVLVEPQAGGWGAGHNKDGERGLVAICDGETFIIPVEVCEYRYPVRVEQFAFNPKVGAGEHIGGHGLIRDYRILNSNAALTTMASRHKHPPWGFAGGHDGSINDVQVHRSAGGYESRATWSNEPLAGGDLVRFISGGGGGYGNPHNRPADKVLDDWKNQYITATEALEYFGVVIDEVAQTVDEVQTKLKRQI
ncbi:MAG: hydantoinase B/oxoprolinase family protein [Oscillospiraceae bacterium]|nr:hydantoinase B/oxoprolinase family protein [Oscillospiraceae bacterium]